MTKEVTLRAALDALVPAGEQAERRDAPLATAVMIGDREHDVRAARACGLDSIGVLYGYGTKEELRQAGATHVVGSPAEILQVLMAAA